MEAVRTRGDFSTNIAPRFQQAAKTERLSESDLIRGVLEEYFLQRPRHSEEPSFASR